MIMTPCVWVVRNERVRCTRNTKRGSNWFCQNILHGEKKIVFSPRAATRARPKAQVFCDEIELRKFFSLAAPTAEAYFFKSEIFA